MIQEDCCSYELSELLKEKGFNPDEYEVHYDPVDHTQYDITLQMACKWLREKHKIHIIAEPCLGEGFDTKLYFNRWFWTIFTEEGEHKPIRRKDEFESNELAISDAIKYCLEHLI